MPRPTTRLQVATAAAIVAASLIASLAVLADGAAVATRCGTAAPPCDAPAVFRQGAAQ